MNKTDQRLPEKFSVKVERMNNTFYDIEVLEPKQIGEGRSVRVYQARVNLDKATRKTMIIKELKLVENNKIEINQNWNDIEYILRVYYCKNNPRYFVDNQEKQKFKDDFAKNKRLFSILGDDMVEPLYLATYEGRSLAFYETNNARSLDNFKSLDLFRIVEVMLSLAKILKNIHDQDIVYMDLSPNNILYDYESRKVRLFDFDACIDLKKKDQVKEIYGPSQQSFLAPELKNTTDMDTIRSFFINPSLDTFMFGSNLFYIITGKYLNDKILEDEELIRDLLSGELNKIKNKIFVDEDISKILIDLVVECVKIYDRFISDSRIIEDLSRAKKSIEKKMRQPLLDLVGAAHILDKHALYDYIDEDSNINVGIIADNEKAKLYFDLIFAPLLIEGVKLNFTFYYRKSSNFHEYLMERAPLLKRTCQIKINGEIAYDKVDESITDDAYAYIDFIEVENFDDLADIEKNTYILILENKITKEENLGKRIFDKVKNDDKKRAIIVRSFDLGKDRADENVNATSLIYYDQIKMATEERGEFEGKILEQAFGVHSFYELSSEERIDRDELFDKFIGSKDLYNVKSSLRSALSIKYKFYDCGIHNSPRPYREFSKLIKNETPIDPDKPQGPTIRDKMAYMEHHSWNKFMIIDGYEKPSDDEFFSYSYKNDNDHRDKEAKPYPFHPLISNYHLKRIDSEEIDEIDRISENISKAQEASIKTSEQSLVYDLKFLARDYDYPLDPVNASLKSYMQKLANIIENIKKGDKDSQAIYKFIDRRIKDLLERGSHQISPYVKDKYTAIDDRVKIIISYKNYKNYRLVDYDIVDAIGQIVYGPVDILYKPFVSDEGSLWKNIAAVLKFRPAQVVFIKDPEENISYKFETIKSFLRDKRHLSSTSIRIIDQNQAKFEVENHYDKNIIFDFTGNTVKQARFTSFLDMARPVPYVIYEGNNQWDGDYEGLDYNLTRPSLSIEETFYLNNARLDTEDRINSFLDLDIYADSLWKVYNSIKGKDYRNYIYTLNMGQNSYIFSLNNVLKSGSKHTKEVGERITQTNRDDFRPILRALDALKENGFIISYSFPNKQGYLEVESYDENYLNKLKEFLSSCIKNRIENISLVKLNHRLDNIETEWVQRRDYYYLVSSSLDCDSEIYTEDLLPNKVAEKFAQEDVKEYVSDFNDFMAKYNNYRQNEDLQIFNILDDKKTDYAIYDRKNDSVRLNFSYGSMAFRDFFTREGNALETYAFFKIARFQDIFDNVGLNIEIDWKADDNFDKDSELIKNEIDIVCIKGLTTYLISCKQSRLRNEFIYEIGYHATKFGIDTVPIIINSYKYHGDELDRLRNRCQQSGVLLIDRDTLDGDLKGYFENLISSKKKTDKIPNL